LQVDGTFDIMSKTMNTVLAEEENNCKCKIHGEYNHLLTWVHCGVEGKLIQEWLLYFLCEHMK
jgi:hypothetical protein